MNKQKSEPHTPFPFAVPLDETMHNPNVLVSVVLPSYNHADFLAESIESVLAQKDVNLELIIVNDGSTDNTTEVLKSYSDTPNIKIIHQENTGLPRALNRGFKEASGSLLTWTSADNRFAPGALSKMSSFLNLNPTVVLTYADVTLIDGDGNPVVNSSYRQQDQSPTNSAHLQLPRTARSLSEINDNFVNACFLYRREILDTTPGYNPESVGFEDYEYWLNASLFGEVAHCGHQSPLYFYRLHADSMTANSSSEELSRAQHSKVESTERLMLQLEQIGAGNTPSSERVLYSSGDELQSWNPRCTTLNNFAVSLNEVTDEVSKASLLPQVIRHKESAERTLICFPSFTPTPGLRRSRDSNYGAITPNAISDPVALIFAPDKPTSADPAQARDFEWSLAMTRELVESNQSTTFALFCSNPEQRATADQINLGLETNLNLRIIEASTEFSEDENSGTAGPAELTLLYCLSSADFILSAKSSQLTLGALCEIRIESLLAACANIPLVVYADSAPEPAATIGHDALAFQLFNALSGLPHISFVLDGSALPNPAEINFSVSTMEQYLKRESRVSISRNFQAFAML